MRVGSKVNKNKNKMVKALYQSMFVSLSALLLAALFVLQPTSNTEHSVFQDTIKEQFAAAALELIEGESFTEPISLVWSSVNDFYSESADSAIALLEDQSLSSLALMFDGEYQLAVETLAAPVIARAPYEEPLLNIVPMEDVESLLDPNFSEDLAYQQISAQPEEDGQVAGVSIEADMLVASEPEPQQAPVVWLTVRDSITSYPYCVAVFNGTVNSYPGACAKDETQHVYAN